MLANDAEHETQKITWKILAVKKQNILNT